MSERPTKVGLACAGGVVEGAFWEIGVLCALEEALEGVHLTQLDNYVGISAGAIIASCLANGIPPHVMRRAVLKQDIPALNLTPQVLFRPALEEYGRRLLDLPGTAVRALLRYLARPQDLTVFGALMHMGSALPVGLFDSTPLERYLAHVFSTFGRTNSFPELPNRLRVLAVNINTSMLTAFGDEATAHVPISKAVQASAALPLVYCPVEIDGEYYIDGVARRTLNASEALAGGAELLFCINPIVPVDLKRASAEGSTMHGDIVELGLPALLSQTFRTLVHSRMRVGFRNYDFLYPHAEVVLIEPELNDPTMFFSNIFSFSNRYHVVDHAYAATRRYLAREAERLEPLLARHGITLREEALNELACSLPPPPPEALRPDLTTGEVVEQARAVLERLERAIAGMEEPPVFGGGNGVRP